MIADVTPIEVEKFQRKIKQARQLALTLSLSPDAVGLDEEDAAVLSILADLLEEIADMSGFVDGGVLFKRHLAGKEAVHA